jgi:fucose 4-O-acetylase-like acetyltransferase
MRNITLDLLKVFSIVLVVLGHSIQYIDQSFDDNIIFKIIYSFHMPLFFFISGAVAFTINLENKCNFNYCIIKKFNNLMIPFFFFLILNYFFYSNIDFFVYLIDIMRNVDKALWFLYVLFIMYILIFLSKIISMKIKTSWYYIFIFFIICLPVEKNFGFYLVKYYAIFFILGYFFYHKEQLFKVNNIVLFILIFIYILIVSLFWSRTGANYIEIYIIKFPIAILGIYLVLVFFRKIESFKIRNISFFNFISTNTLGIYGIHFYFLNFINSFLNLSLWSNIYSTFIFSFICTLLTIKLISYNNVLSKIILGR